VGRRDLRPGLRAAQIGHVLIHWVLKNGQPPDNLVLLEVENEPDLEDLRDLLYKNGIFFESFHEPDLGDELTALAIGPDGWRSLSSLPLGFRR
jgi:hypothetical protein